MAPLRLQAPPGRLANPSLGEGEQAGPLAEEPRLPSASEVYLAGVMTPVEEDEEPAEPGLRDRVLHTAGDRPTTASLPALADPAADHLDQTVRDRRADVDAKHGRIIEFLDANGYDAAVLGRADSVAWFTAGGDLAQAMTSDSASVLLYITRKSRAVVTDNVQSARVFEEELAGLGFQLKERPWTEDLGRVIEELGHRKQVASDGAIAGWLDERRRLAELRWPLTRLERQWLRELGRTLTHAVEATSRNFMPGETEADVAGHLSHRLIREGVVPVDVRVAADDRMARYRRPSFKAAAIQRRATIGAVGRRHGLHASLTRTVSFGSVEPDILAAHGLASMVDATCIYFSRPGETVGNVFRRALRIYEKFGRPDEWMLDYQGFLIGYHPREARLVPEDARTLAADMALCWGPSVGPARSEDTVVIDTRGYEVVTEAQRWPKIEVMVKGFPISRPGILVR